MTTSHWVMTTTAELVTSSHPELLPSPFLRQLYHPHHHHHHHLHDHDSSHPHSYRHSHHHHYYTWSPSSSPSPSSSSPPSPSPSSPPPPTPPSPVHCVMLTREVESSTVSLALAAASINGHGDSNSSSQEVAWWENGWVRGGGSWEGIVHPHWLNYAPLPYAFHVCVGVLMVFTALSSLVGNGLVLWSFFRFRSLRTSSNLFIISLALADILMSSVDFPLFSAASFLGHWAFGYHVCQLYGSTTGIAGLVTINTLAAISYDRYTVLVRRVGPVRYISKSMTLKVILVIWLLSVLWIVPPLAGWSHYTLEGIGTTCTFDYLTRTPLNASYIIVLMITNFLFPLLVILYSYVRIFLSVASVQRGLMDCSPQISIGTQRQRFRRQTEMKTASSLLIIVCFFCLAWTPYVIVALMGLVGDVSLVSPMVSALPCILAKVATVSNPPLYSIGHPKFRKKIRYLVNLSLRRGSTPHNSLQTTQDNPRMIFL